MFDKITIILEKQGEKDRIIKLNVIDKFNYKNNYIEIAPKNGVRQYMVTDFFSIEISGRKDVETFSTFIVEE